MPVQPDTKNDKVFYDPINTWHDQNVKVTMLDETTLEIWGSVFLNGDPLGAGGSFPIATQAEAEAGVNNSNAMTPLRTSQHLAANFVGNFPNDSATNAKLANMAQNRIKGRVTASTGDPEDLTPANIRTIIASDAGGTTNFFRADGTFAAPVATIADGDKGDITVSSTGTVWTIDSNTITNAKLDTIATNRFKGRVTAATGAVEDLTPANARTVLLSDSGGGTTNYLRADGSFAAPPGTFSLANDSVTNAILNNMATATFKGRTTAGTGDPEDLTVAQALALITSTSGGGTTNFLSAAGTWIAPGGGGISDGDKGDIVVSSSGTVWTIDAGVVTNAKIGETITTSKGGTGKTDWGVRRVVLTGDTASADPLRNMLAGTAGYALTSGGSGVDPSWTDLAALYQPLDSDLTTIAGLTATTDNVVQSVAGAWASRTPAQLKTTLALVKADVGLANVDNTADASKPLVTTTVRGLVPPTGTPAGNFLKDDLTWAAPGGGSLTDGDKGDITVASGGTVWTIDAAAVTLAKMANLAQDQVIGRVTASTGVPETFTVTAAARTVLDDVSVSAMLTTLGGVNKAGDTMTGTLTIDSGFGVSSTTSGTLNLDIPGAGGTIRFVTNGTSKVFVSDTGLTFRSGYLIELPQDPVGALEAATKQYVDNNFQAKDTDLTTIAGLTATTDNMIQSVGSAWASRTPAQVKAALAIAQSDVASLVTDLANKQPLDSDLTTIAGLTATTDNFLISVSSAWASRTPAQAKTTLALNNVDNTSDATKNSATVTLTNKRITPRVGTVTSSATPTINTDNVDEFNITALAAAITSMTTNLSGTPTDGQKLLIRITGDATPRTIAWGTSFASSGNATLLATTAASKTHMVGLIWNAVTSKWVCHAVDATGY